MVFDYWLAGIVTAGLSSTSPTRCYAQKLLGGPPVQTSTLRKRMRVTALTDLKIIVPAIGVAFANSIHEC